MTLTLQSTTTSFERCSASILGRAAGSQSLDSLKEAVAGWTAEEMNDMPGKNPLHMAAWQGCIENVLYLIEEIGCNINSISTAEFSYGKTPIFFAATKCRSEVVMYLLEKGARVTIVNNKGQSVRSIASSHLLPHVMERICQCECDQEWTNYRETHSDQLEYGDLDPRFLDRPLRDSDAVTEHANPHLVKSSTTTTKTKKRNNRQPRKRQSSLSEEELQQVENAWTRVLESLKTIDSEDTHSATMLLQTDMITIVQLSDKQQGSWIPEAAERLQNVCSDRVRLVEFLTTLSVNNNSNKRERILLEKLIAEICGTRGIMIESSSSAVSSDSSRHSSLHTRLLMERREELELILANESMTRFQQQRQDRLCLPEQPCWVDSVAELQSLENAMRECQVVAIDTEWYTREDGNIHVATLQVAIPGMPRPWVLDLFSESLKYQEKTKQLVHQVLFDPYHIVFGFAMGNDLPKIEEWLGSELSRSTCLDVQMLHSNGEGSLKGLANIVQLYSDIPLSKTEQCSSWSDRPLSRDQLEYAGLDAAILPVLVAEWLRRWNP